MIDYAEEDALKRILRHHHATITRRLVEDLSTLLAWVREDEATKGRVSPEKPPLLFTELSKMGIYGSEMINKVEMSVTTPPAG